MNFKLNLSDNKVWCFLRAFIRMSCLRRVPYYVWVGFLSFFADSKICNLRSDSVFSSFANLKKNITTGKAKRKESLIQTFYETSAAHFFLLIDICRISQPILLPLHALLVCKFIIRGIKADSLT